MLKPCSVCDKYIALAPEDNEDLCRACKQSEFRWREKIAKELDEGLDSRTVHGYTFTRKQNITDIVRRYHGVHGY